MKTGNFVRVCLAMAGLNLPGLAALHGAAPATGGLVWEKDSLEYTTKPGERYSHFKFWFTNTSSNPVSINSAKSSCFCTVAKLPQEPWPIAPGSNGFIEVSMDLAGKSVMVIKPVNVDTTAGRHTLMVKTVITPAQAQRTGAVLDADRLKNMETALADRQAVFKKAECASCHAEPAKGKTGGAELYAAVCAICHDSAHRAPSVPDLKNLPHPTNADHWRQWIAHGRAGSMMPAFAQSEGGPLTEPQIAALTDYLARTIPGRAAAGTQALAPTASGGFLVPSAR